MELRAYEQAFHIDRDDKDGTMREQLTAWQQETLWGVQEELSRG